MAMVVLADVFGTFCVQWSILINDNRNSLLGRQSLLEVYNCEPLTSKSTFSHTNRVGNNGINVGEMDHPSRSFNFEWQRI